MSHLVLCFLLVFIVGCSEYSNNDIKSAKQPVLLNPKNSVDIPKPQLIHGWNASQVKKLQLNVSAKLGIEKGTTFQDIININGESVLGPKMIIIPPGKFVMGCYEGDVSCFPRNNIKIIITIDYPFAVAESELSVADWNICVEAGACKQKSGGNNSIINKTLNQSVTDVSWSDAQSYVKWLSKVTGEKYRLHSESEHEYISRAGGTGNLLGNVLNCRDEKYQSNNSNECFFNPRERVQESLDSADYSANAWGVKLIHANKWEWLKDCYHHSIDKYTPRDGRSYPVEGPCKSKLYIGRGGSMGGVKKIIRSSSRHIGRLRDKEYSDFTIRLARDID